MRMQLYSKGLLKRGRIYEFLAGLNIEFDAIRIQILGKEDLQFLNDTLAIARAKEERREVMLQTPTVKNSALITRKVHMQQSSAEHQGNEVKRSTDGAQVNKDLLWCTYCKKPRHIIEKCWKLHGKPQAESRVGSDK